MIIGAGWRTYLGTRGTMISRSVYRVRHPRGSYVAYPIAVAGSGHSGKQVNSFDAVIHTW